MDLAARHAQVLQDQIRHGFATRQPYRAADDVRAGRRRSGSWLDREDHASALEQIARQDRIRLRALCAALRALRGGDRPRCDACLCPLESVTCRDCW